MYRVYSTTAAGLIGKYRRIGPSFEKKIRKLAKTTNDTYDPTQELEVTEFWDRRWFLLAVNNEHVVTIEHNYTRVPFIVKYACFGRSGHTQSIGSSRLATVERIDGLGTQRFVVGVTGNNANRQESLMQMAQPFLWRRFPGARHRRSRGWPGALQISPFLPLTGRPEARPGRLR